MKKIIQKNVAVILNPISVADQPVISFFHNAFFDQGTNWQTYITNKGEDVVRLTQRIVRTKPDVIYVLGGDGTQTKVMEGMGKSKIPLALLPAGTANIMSKELGIAQNLEEAVQELSRSNGETCAITRCRKGKEDFFLRLSIGVLADMVANSNRKKKQQLGLLAYPLSALESWQQSQPQTFHFKIDGKSVSAEGVSLVINNFGNIGLPGISFLPEIDPCDALLDLIVVQAQDIPSLISLAKTTIADKKSSPLLQHWSGKKIEVKLPESTLLIHDDEKQEVRSFTAQTTKDKVFCLLPRKK